jgi:hypothetical protein
VRPEPATIGAVKCGDRKIAPLAGQQWSMRARLSTNRKWQTGVDPKAVQWIGGHPTIEKTCVMRFWPSATV